jgi:hypothetical protein
VWWLYLTWLLPAFWACLRVVARRSADTAPLPGWRRSAALWAPRAALGIAFALTLIPFNHPTIAVGILLLWVICGALYLRGAQLRLSGRDAPATPPMRQAHADAAALTGL